MRPSSVFRAICIAVVAGAPVIAAAQMSDGHGNQLQSYGLGQSRPSAADVSLRAEWKVYRFQRDGVSYYQVNDLDGRVHLIVGCIDGTFWTLPAGERPSTVALPGQRVAIAAGAPLTLVYEESGFRIVAHGVGVDAVWSVETR